MSKYKKLYTHGGDKGTTSKWCGDRVDKDEPSVVCVGKIDSLSAAIGIIKITPDIGIIDKQFANLIQETLISVMGLISYSSPATVADTSTAHLRKLVSYGLDRMLTEIDDIARGLDHDAPEQTHWVCYGSEGILALTYDTMSTEVRECEVNIVKTIKEVGYDIFENELILKYFNAFSKYLYLKAREYALKYNKESVKASMATS